MQRECEAGVHKKINIVIASDSCEVDGGASLVAIDDAQALVRRGHRVIFFSSCGVPPEQQSGIEWISLGQKTILDEPSRWKAGLMGLWNFRTARALEELLATLPSESTVVHLHSWSKALSGSVVHLAHKKRYRLVCTLHEYFVACPNGGLYDYPGRHICVLKPMSIACVTRNCDSRARIHKIWRVVRQLVWRYLAGIPGNFDRMITVSKFSAEKLSSLLHGADIDVVDNLPMLRQKSLIPADQRSAVIYAGRVSAEKGVDVYLDACRILAIQAEVLGDGPLLPTLKATWPEVQFKGWLSKSDLSKRLSSARALVVPSLWYENSPMIIAEAASLGIPVIVSDGGAASTLVEDGMTGLHFKNGDAADLAVKIAMLQNNPERAFVMGETAYNRFWQNYAERRFQRIEKLETCYMQVLGIPA